MSTEKSLADKLQEQVDGLELLAEGSEAVATHFRPRFEACWVNGQLVNPLALKLRFWVIDKEHEARAWRQEAADLKEAIKALAMTAASAAS